MERAFGQLDLAYVHFQIQPNVDRTQTAKKTKSGKRALSELAIKIVPIRKAHAAFILSILDESEGEAIHLSYFLVILYFIFRK